MDKGIGVIGLLLALVLSVPSPCTLPTIASTPTPDGELVTVVLPAALDPTGCPQQLPHGTRVYKIPSILVEYGSGEVTNFTIFSGYGFTETRQGATTIYRDECGNAYSFLDVIKVKHSSGLAFSAPNLPLTKEFCKAVPDYVVP
jgi:hypothetical protein